MKIAVLAWGSLVWDRRELRVDDAFKPIGPILPIEFCRVSSGGRLTLVIDEAVGARCTTYAAQSAFVALDDALGDLWTREGPGDEALPLKIKAHGRVGWIEVASGTYSQKANERHPNAIKTIGDWTHARGFDATIWTALAGNFQDKIGQPFSVDAAICHLEGLSEAELPNALRYIRCAPPEVQTPVRTAVEQRWPQA